MYKGALIAGRYRLKDLLGSGAAGQVWRAMDEKLHREDAIKLVNLAQSTETVTPERFRREVIATTKLHHPNIVTVYDAGMEGDVAYMVMELLRGESLADMVRQRGYLSVDDTVSIALQVSRALETTHGIGVVHRDIKPANIMVHEGTAKLLDFGIARLASENSVNLTGPSMAIGTAAYMSPEQALGHPVESPSDIYSFGCVLMTMLTGQPPFPGQSAVEVANRQINEAPPRVRDRQPRVPAALDELVNSMLNKDAAQRPNAAMITALLSGETPTHDATQVMGGAGVAATVAGTQVLPSSTSVLPEGGPLPSAQRLDENTVNVVNQDDAEGTGVQVRDEWFGKALKTIVLAIAAIVALIVVWAVGTVVFNNITASMGQNPTASTSAQPSSKKTTPSAKPTQTAPTSSFTFEAPSVPPVNEAAMKAAIAGVDTALSVVSDADTKARLQKQWAVASKQILAGNNAAARVEDFTKQVDRERDKGNLNGAEHLAISSAVKAVGALV